jgi:apolipoprotein N-acyltransferase
MGLFSFWVGDFSLIDFTTKKTDRKGERAIFCGSVFAFLGLQLCDGFLPEMIKVNSGGWTTWLWVKEVFGFCGELWLVFGYCGIFFGFEVDFALIRGVIGANFWLQMCGQSVVFCVAGDGDWLATAVNESSWVSPFAMYSTTLPGHRGRAVGLLSSCLGRTIHHSRYSLVGGSV